MNREAEKRVAQPGGNSAAILREVAFLGVGKLLEKFDTSADGLSDIEVVNGLVVWYQYHCL